MTTQLILCTSLRAYEKTLGEGTETLRHSLTKQGLGKSRECVEMPTGAGLIPAAGTEGTSGGTWR